MEDNYRREMIDFLHEDNPDLISKRSEHKLGDLPLDTRIFDGEDVFGLNAESQKPSVFNRAATIAGRALKKAALPAMAGISLLTGAYANIIDNAQHLAENPVVFETVQTVPDSGYSIDTPITDGSRIVFEENGKIAMVNTTDGSVTRSVSQISGLKDARTDNGSTSFKMIDGQNYSLLARDSNGFLRSIESDNSGSEPTWYNVSQASDGEHVLRAGNNGGVIRENIGSGNEQTIYSNGAVSNLRVDGDLNLFVANETTSNGTLERLILVDSTDLLNATVLHSGAVKFAEMSNGSIHVGVENQQNSQTVDLYTFDQNGTQVGSPIVGLTPNTFDVDDGKMVKIENNGTVYAVDINTGNQVELTNTNVSKSDIDMEGSIATWVQNGTQVAYVTIPDVINATNQSSGPTLEDLMNQLNATNAQLNQTRDQLNASQANETNYLANISNLTAEITSLQGNATNNSAEISRLNGEVSNLTAEVSSYLANATNDTAEISRLNGEISNRTAEIASLQGNATNYSAEISRLNGEVSNLTTEVSSYISNETNNSAEISRLNGEISNLTAEILVFEGNETNNSAEINRLNSEISNRTAEIASLQGNATNYSAEISRLNSEISNRTSEIASLQGNATNDTSEINRLNSEIGNLTAEVGIYQTNATNDTAEISRLNGEISNRTAEILGLESNELTYLADIDRLNGDVSNLTAEISDYLTQLNTMTDQRDENATLVSSLEDQLNDAANQRDENATLVGSLSGQISDLESDKSNAISYGNDLANQRDDNATRVGELKEELKNAEDNMTDAVVGLAIGGAVGAAIATKRASKPEVDFDPEEE